MSANLIIVFFSLFSICPINYYNPIFFIDIEVSGIRIQAMNTGILLLKNSKF